jgi:hypothetical protein
MTFIECENCKHLHKNLYCNHHNRPIKNINSCDVAKLLKKIFPSNEN